MTLRLNGSTSGYTEIDCPSVGGNNTLVLPTGNGSADQALVTNGSGTLSFADRGRMVLETAKASTSGTSVDFTGIPSWVKKITVMFNGVSTNGSSIIQIQLGSTTFTTSSYISNVSAISGGSAGSNNITTGFGLYSNAAANTWIGSAVLTLVASNLWVCNSVTSYTTNSVCMMTGNVTLSGTLDRVRITTVNGTDTFDAGSINILYEG
jgi:hypothetical protein